MMGRRKLRPPVVALLLLVAWGAYVRLADLGHGSLALEELNHLYVGTALAEGKGPVLPSGTWYGRGLEYSRMVEFASRYIDDPELAVRLPSALLGTASVALVAAGTYALAGPVPAVAATLLFAAYPQAIIQARLGRFYMLQLLPGLIALFLGWVAVRKPAGRASRSELAMALAAGVAATVAILLSMRYQVTGITTLFAWWLFLLVAGVRDVRGTPGARFWKSPPLVLAYAMAASGAVLLLTRPYLIPALLVRAFSTPHWARENQFSWTLYYDGLSVGYPLIGSFALASFAILLKRRTRLGAYLLTMFLVPTLLLSFVLPFKADRFLLVAVPPLFVAIAIALEEASAILGRWFMIRGDRERWSALSARRLVLYGLFAFVAMGSFPALLTAGIGYHRFTSMPDWTAARQVLAERTDLGAVPIGSSRSLPAGFYLGKVDFSVALGHLEKWDPDLYRSLYRLGSGQGAYRMVDAGSPDMYAGVPVLPHPSTLRDWYGTAGEVVIAIDDNSINNSMIEPALLEALASEAEELCQERCGSLQLYHWKLGSPPPAAYIASARADSQACDAEAACAPLGNGSNEAYEQIASREAR